MNMDEPRTDSARLDGGGYQCPMHPEVISPSPGRCPECGMDLLPIKPRKGKNEHEKGHEAAGHDKPSSTKVPAADKSLTDKPAGKHAGHSTNLFLKKFWLSLALSVPVVLYSDLPARLFGWSAPEFLGAELIPIALSTIVFFYGGWIFLASAFRELRARLPGMMTLIAIAILAAYTWSVWSFFARAGHDLFWELTTLITVMLLGHWVEMKAVKGTQHALEELSKLMPDTAEVMRDGKTEVVPISEVKAGDILFVRPGGKIPADGVVVSGTSEVDESMATGESRPVLKTKESEVIAGTSNGDGSLTIRVTKVGDETFLAGVMRLVSEAQASKSRLQMLSDRAAFYLTIVAVVVGAITFFVWFLSAGVSVGVERLVAVLVIACPHALGLAVPLVASISTSLAARHGFLIRNRIALESARKVGVVLFDKTGTLTKGAYGVLRVWSFDAWGENEVLRTAASLDANSEHFIARAIVAAAKEKNIQLAEVDDFVRIPGKGVQGKIGGTIAAVGGTPLLPLGKDFFSEAVAAEIEKENRRGATVVYVLLDNRVLGAIALADVIREESREAIRDLKKLGVRVAMVTGDAKPVAEWVARELEIDETFADVLPQEKSEKVKELQKRGLSVMMVGDGVNDAPALTQADVGVAIGAGTNVAIESAGIILARNDPRDIVKIIGLSRATYRKMIENLFWATGYNVIALPIAAGVLAPWGILLTPAFSAVLMSFSTIIVAANAVLLRRVERRLW